MKKLISIMGIIAVTATAFTSNNGASVPKAVTVQSAYVNGYKDGFCAGWKDYLGQLTICPMAPMAPMPEMGQDNYRGGFVRGFKDGYVAARNSIAETKFHQNKD